MSHTPVGSTIRALRDLRGLSRKALAAAADCSQPTIFRVENGQQDPTLPLLLRILDALDADERTRLSLVSPSAPS